MTTRSLTGARRGAEQMYLPPPPGSSSLIRRARDFVVGTLGSRLLQLHTRWYGASGSTFTCGVHVCVCVLGEGVFVCACVVLCAVMGYRFRLNLTRDAQDNEKRNIRRYHATCIRGTSIHCNLLSRLTTIEMKNERV